ncbi:MAG TPA: hypothetical protein VF053_10055 [Streptosporangiales bacterium]
MSDRSNGDGVWEDLLILVVVGAAVVYGYHKLKPKALDWLDAHDVHVGDLARHAGSLTLDSWVNIGAILIGVALLVALWRGVRSVRRRDRGKKRSRKVW